MKRFIEQPRALSVVTAVAVLALAGCSGTPSPSASPTTAATASPAATSSASPSPITEDQTLTIGTDSTDRVKDVVAAFEAANPGFTVEIVDGGSAYQEFMRTRITAGTAPDVIRTFPGSANPVTVQGLDNDGILADLSDRSWVSTLNGTQKVLFASSDGARILAVPMSASAIGINYNDQALAALGATPPTTWDEVLKLCDLAKSQGKVAYALFNVGGFGGLLTSYAMVASLVYGPDPSFTQKQLAGEVSFADSGWRTAFELQLQMSDAGCLNEGVNGTDYDAAVQLVATGEALGLVAFTDTNAIAALAPDGTTFTMTPLPVSNDASEQYLAVADSYGWGINAKTENPELARRFIDFLATAEAQNLFAGATGGAPSIPNDTFKPTLPTQQTLVDYLAEGKTGSWPDQGWPNANVPPVLTEVLLELYAGKETPEGAAGRMDEAFSGS